MVYEMKIWYERIFVYQIASSYDTNHLRNTKCVESADK